MVDAKQGIDEITGYRTNTRNLVIAGSGDWLDSVETRLGEHHISVRRIEEKLSYDRIPSVVADDGTSMTVYLIRTNDLFGAGLTALAHNAQRLLEPFDSVDGVFWIGGESDGCKGIQKIKVRGEYVGIFATPTEKR